MDFRTLSSVLSVMATMHLGPLNAVIHYFSRSLDGVLSRSGDLDSHRQILIGRTIIGESRLYNVRSPVYAPTVMNFRRSMSDEPILSKFSAEVTISVQLMVPTWPTWKSLGTVGTFSEIIVR